MWVYEEVTKPIFDKSCHLSKSCVKKIYTFNTTWRKFNVSSSLDIYKWRRTLHNLTITPKGFAIVILFL